MRTVLRIALAAIAVLIAVVLIAVLVVTNTTWGRERVRRLALEALRTSVHGIVHIGPIRGNLLQRAIITDLTITDSAGNPFLSVARARVQYDLWALLSKRVTLTSLALERPVVVLDHPPGGEWNFARLFPSSGPADTARGFGSWITIDNVRITDGRIVVRTPWTASDSLPPVRRDSLVRAALTGQTRARVERATIGTGYQTVMEFRSIHAAMPRVRLADPDSASRLFSVGALRMVALPFRPPGAEIRDVRGVFRMSADSLWFRGVAAELPGTKLRLGGTYLLASGRILLDARAEPLALADLRWIVPNLPSSGGGPLHLLVRYDPEGQSDFVARDIRLALEPGRLSGEVGVAMGPLAGALRVHDTELRFSEIDTRLIQQLLPEVELPRRGTLDGRAALSGTMQAMRVDAEVAFDDASREGGTSHVWATGTVGQEGGGIRLGNFRLRADPVQLDLARAVRPTLPVRGTLVGTVTANGSTTGRLTAAAALVHRDRGAVSRITARGFYVGSGHRRMDVDVRVAPLALATAGRFAPALELHGTAAGQLRVAGALDSLRIAGDLHLPDGGALTARGWADIASAEKRYDLTTRLDVFNLRSVTALGPPTSITAAATARGEGLDPETMRAALAVNVSQSAVDSVPLDSLHLRVAVANGMATIDSMSLTGPIVHAVLDGTFGLGAGRRGLLTYRVGVDSLAGLRRLLPAADTGAVTPRPGRVAAALARARADSARLAERTEVERAATGAPPPTLDMDSVRALARDSVAGSLYAAGQVTGGLSGFDLHGRLAVQALVARGAVVRNGRVDYAWVGARTPASAIAAGASLDSVEAGGFALDSVSLRTTYRPVGGAGHVELAIYQDTGTSYSATVDLALHTDHRELHLRDLRLRFGPTRWAAVHPARIRWGKAGIEVRSLELRDAAAGRIAVDGSIPTEGAADLRVEVVGLQVANVVGLLQGDLAATGILMFEGRLAGTRRDPVIEGAAGYVNGTFRGAPLPDLRASFTYADTALRARADLSRGRGHSLASMTAEIPVNLALAGFEGPRRLLDRPMRIDVRADSLPLDALPKFTDAVADVHGRVIGALAARGTPRKPSVAGQLAVDFASFRIVPMGVTFRDINGLVRMLGDTIVVDSLAGRSGGGSISIAGGIGIANATRPSFALTITGRDAEVLNTDLGQLRASADLALRGPFTQVALTGRANILGGVIYVPEASGRNVVSLDDPAVFGIVDTTVAENRDLLPSQSPLLQNLRIQVALAVSPDTWLRTADANVEIYSTGDLSVRVDSAGRAIILDGTMNTNRGDYTYLGRRFLLSRGTVTFSGTSELDPLLQLRAVRNIELAGRGTLNIQILVGGTLRRPTITLQSDAQPPISQTDLLSYLAFGQSSSSLLQAGGSSGLAGQSTSTGQLAGKAAGIATRQLATVALDVMAKQAQMDIGRSLGADVLNITPADIPTDFSLTGVETLLAGTQVEAGKYVSSQTFVVLQARPTFVAPGLRIEHRMPKGYRIEAGVEPRFLLRQPTLSENQDLKPTSVLGAFLIREWRF